MSYWYQIAIDIIQNIIDQFGKEDLGKLKREITKAYPWPPRENWPYKCWLKACKKLCPEIYGKNKKENNILF